MRPVITPEEAARLDSIASDPVGVLMERAGLGVALAAARMGARYGARVVILAGPGNNGGDGYVAARHLQQRGADVHVRSLGYPKGDYSPARRAAASAVAAGVRVEPLGEPEPADLIVDALFGAGFHGALPGPVLPWLDHPAPVLAVDLPSGLNGADGTTEGPVVRAARTVTFDAAKVGHLVGSGPAVTGELEIVGIGLPEPEAAFVRADIEDAPVPARRRDAHKWSSGAVAVVGGSAGLVGAAVMAAEAALRFGAGAVRLFVPGGLRSEAATGHPGIMTEGIGAGDGLSGGDAAKIIEMLDRFDVLVLGPGLGSDRSDFVEAILGGWDGPVVLDADGLGHATKELITGREGPIIITPHAGEFERLTGVSADHDAAFSFADETGAIVLLKGNPTFIGGTERWAVDSGGAELATIGTGDVLAGMIGALVARGLDPETAARSAAYRHGLAGSSLSATTSVTAVGLLDEIGRWAN